MTVFIIMLNQNVLCCLFIFIAATVDFFFYFCRELVVFVFGSFLHIGVELRERWPLFAARCRDRRTAALRPYRGCVAIFPGIESGFKQNLYGSIYGCSGSDCKGYAVRAARIDDPGDVAVGENKVGSEDTRRELAYLYFLERDAELSHAVHHHVVGQGPGCSHFLKLALDSLCLRVADYYRDASCAPGLAKDYGIYARFNLIIGYAN